MSGVERGAQGVAILEDISMMWPLGTWLGGDPHVTGGNAFDPDTLSTAIYQTSPRKFAPGISCPASSVVTWLGTHVMDQVKVRSILPGRAINCPCMVVVVAVAN